MARHACILKSSSQFISQSDREILERYNIRSLVLDGCPRWLKKWICLILQYMDFEYGSYYEKAYERYWRYFLDEENIKFQEIRSGDGKLKAKGPGAAEV